MNTLSMFADPVTQRIKRRGPDDYPTWARHGVIDLGYHGKTLAHIVQGPRTHRQRPSMISMAQFHIQLCGRMSITGPHGVIDQRELSGVVGRQILAMLALANGPVGRYELVDMVWHGQPTKAVDSTVNATLSRLRAAIAAAGGDPNVMTSEQGLIELAGYQFTTDFGNAVTAIDRDRGVAAVGVGVVVSDGDDVITEAADGCGCRASVIEGRIIAANGQAVVTITAIEISGLRQAIVAVCVFRNGAINVGVKIVIASLAIEQGILDLRS